jgi:hypothetical protein
MSLAVLPQPPLDSAVSSTVETTVTSAIAAIGVAALAFALTHWRISGRPTVLMLLLAGGAMMVLEPFVDLVGACWHPSNLTRAFTLWERPMPVWLCLTYFVYFGIGGGLSWLAVRRSASRRTIWALFFAGIAGDVVLENVLLNWHLYVYYGHQPLKLLNFPLWWAAVNSTVNVVVAVAVVRYARSLQGMLQLLIIPLAVGISLALNSIVGFASWTAINSGFDGIVLQLSGLVTFGVAVALMHLLANAMANPATHGDAAAPHGGLALTDAR